MNRKTINKMSDLAVAGAPPLLDSPLHVGRPNIGDHDFFLSKMRDILESGQLTNRGPIVEELEAKLCQILSVKHCVLMCNGTIALEIATRALNFRKEVILPSFTFIATAHALSWQNIRPMFADINPRKHHIDPDSIRNLITPNTTGIVAVHLWGQPAPIRELASISNEFDIPLVYDAAHAFNARFEGIPIGNFGACEVFSFHATKFFNTFEGGAVVTNNDEIAEKVRLMQNFGFRGLDTVIYPGTNAKMTECCAAMGLVNLQNVDFIFSRNKENYKRYFAALGKNEHVKILEQTEGESNYQYVVIEILQTSASNRDGILTALRAENILARKYFWPGCHNMSPYKENLPHFNSLLPNTNMVAERVLVLPTGPSVDSEHIESIAYIIQMLTSNSINNFI